MGTAAHQTAVGACVACSSRSVGSGQWAVWVGLSFHCRVFSVGQRGQERNETDTFLIFGGHEK